MQGRTYTENYTLTDQPKLGDQPQPTGNTTDGSKKQRAK